MSFFILILFLKCIFGQTYMGDCFAKSASTFSYGTGTTFNSTYTVTLSAGQYCDHYALLNFVMGWTDTSTITSTVQYLPYENNTFLSQCMNTGSSTAYQTYVSGTHMYTNTNADSTNKYCGYYIVVTNPSTSSGSQTYTFTSNVPKIAIRHFSLTLLLILFLS